MFSTTNIVIALLLLCHAGMCQAYDWDIGGTIQCGIRNNETGETKFLKYPGARLELWEDDYFIDPDDHLTDGGDVITDENGTFSGLTGSEKEILTKEAPFLVVHHKCKIENAPLTGNCYYNSMFWLPLDPVRQFLEIKLGDSISAGIRNADGGLDPVKNFEFTSGAFMIGTKIACPSDK